MTLNYFANRVFGMKTSRFCLPHILSLFHNELDKFNNAGRMLDCIYHMKLNYFVIAFLI